MAVVEYNAPRQLHPPHVNNSTKNKQMRKQKDVSMPSLVDTDMDLQSV
jgi:hypothetical protein